MNKGKIVTFTDLDAWKEGHALVLKIYQVTENFPKSELFGLVSQMRRCAISITSNLAEGFSRISYKEKVQFYYIALGSVAELQNQLLVARDIRFLVKDMFEEMYKKSISLHKIINGLIKKSREKFHDS